MYNIRVERKWNFAKVEAEIHDDRIIDNLIRNKYIKLKIIRTYDTLLSLIYLLSPQTMECFTSNGQSFWFSVDFQEQS